MTTGPVPGSAASPGDGGPGDGGPGAPMAGLGELGVPPAVAQVLAARYGETVADRVRADPWTVLRAPGVLPAQADAFARRVDPSARRDDPRRSRALVVWLLSRAATDGDTTMRAPVLLSGARGAGAGVEPDAVLEAALATGEVVLVEDTRDVALAELVAAEEACAEELARLVLTAEDEPGVVVVDGPPGPGRQQAVSGLLDGIPRARLAVVDARDIVDASIGLGPGGGGRDVARRGPSARDALARDPEAVVVRAAERLDVVTAAGLLAAVPDGARLVLTGLVDGLAASPGRVLADVAACPAVPVVRAPRPGGGPLAGLEAGLRAGELPTPAPGALEVVVVAVRDAAEAVHRVGQVVTQSLPQRAGLAGSDVAVLAPRRSGPAGAQAIAAALTASRAGGAAAEGAPRVSPGETAAGPLVSTVADAAGGTWPAVVLVLPPEALGAVDVPLLVSAGGAAARQLTVVTGLGSALPALVRERRHRARRTRLGTLLSDALGEP